MVARRAHNPKVVGSNPAPATKIKASEYNQGPFYLPIASIQYGALTYNHEPLTTMGAGLI